MLKFAMKRTMPSIPGIDFAGIVEEVGAAVSDYKPGDEVFGSMDVFADEARGSYAEYVSSYLRCNLNSLQIHPNLSGY